MRWTTKDGGIAQIRLPAENPEDSWHMRTDPETCDIIIEGGVAEKLFTAETLEEMNVIHLPIPTPAGYECDPEKNTTCRKSACYINGGPCRITTHKEFRKRDTE